MKLAEALLERKRLGAEIGALNSRFIASAIIEAGEQPEENAGKILQKLEGVMADHRELVVRINTTNNAVVLPSFKGITIMQAIALRDSCKQKTGIYGTIVEALRGRNRSSYGNQPRKVLAAGVEMEKISGLHDQAGKLYRQLDAELQSLNWTTDLS